MHTHKINCEINMNCQQETCFHKPCTPRCVFQDIDDSVERVCTWCMESKTAAIRMQQEHSSLWKFIISLQVPVCTLQSVHSHSFPEGAASLDSVRNIWAQYLTSFMQSETCSWMNKIYTQTYTPNIIINKNISQFAASSVRTLWMKKQLLRMIRTALPYLQRFPPCPHNMFTYECHNDQHIPSTSALQQQPSDQTLTHNHRGRKNFLQDTPHRFITPISSLWMALHCFASV